jgi:hypothetical protein
LIVAIGSPVPIGLPSASFTARVTGDDGRTLLVHRDGDPFRSLPVTGADFTTTFEAPAPGRYRLQLQRGSAIDTVSSPIYLEPGRRRCSAATAGPCGCAARPAGGSGSRRAGAF